MREVPPSLNQGVLDLRSYELITNVNGNDWSQAAPLSNNEIKNYINGNILPLLRVMMLADNEGWVMFNPNNRKKQRDETLRTFEEVKMLITG